MTLRSFYLLSRTWEAQWRMLFCPSRSARRARASLLLPGVLICVILAAVGASMPGKSLSVWHMVVAKQLLWAFIYYRPFFKTFVMYFIVCDVRTLFKVVQIVFKYVISLISKAEFEFEYLYFLNYFRLDMWVILYYTLISRWFFLPE